MLVHEGSIDRLVAALAPLRLPATEGAIAAAERALGTLPGAYKEFLRRSDGYEGSPCPECYVQLYAVAELAELNRGYMVAEMRPGLVLFGTDGGGEGYFFDMAAGGAVLRFAFISDWYDDAIVCAGSFVELLEGWVGRRG